MGDMGELTIRISDKVLKVAGAILGALFLVWGFSHLWSSGVFRPKYQIQIFVPEAEGVCVGAPVRLDGMPIGSVSRVELASNSTDSARRIEIVLRVEKRFQNMIHEDSNASLLREGLLGERYVDIHRGFAGLPMNAGGETRVVPVSDVTLTDCIDVVGKKSGCQSVATNSPRAKSPASTRTPATPESELTRRA